MRTSVIQDRGLGVGLSVCQVPWSFVRRSNEPGRESTVIGRMKNRAASWPLCHRFPQLDKGRKV